MDLANGYLKDPELSIGKLKEDICAAVEAEIQDQVTEYEITDEEFLEISRQAWSRLYSCALQYHQTEQRPHGKPICISARPVIPLLICSL